MARKVVLFIVEGPSDEDALGTIFSKLYHPDYVHVEVYRGDITSEKSTEPSNVLDKIGNIVRAVAQKRRLKRSDFKKVVHIVDLDGAYIPDEAIIDTPTQGAIKYTTEQIFTHNKWAICERNERKKRNLNKLSKSTEVWHNIPYHVYYMSANLDHVLYDRLNSSEKEKKKNAFAFSEYYSNHLALFKEYMCHSEFSVRGEYHATWEFIKVNTRSLERHCNLCSLIKEDNL